MTPGYNPFDNQRFREELGELLDKKLTPIADMVAEHERILQRSKGGIWIVGVLWTMLLAGLELLFHARRT